jgi:HAMP domain-containing protein
VKLNSESIDTIFRGKSGIGIVKDYLGEEVLSSYAPLEVQGLRWGILAKFTTREVYEPVRRFTRNLMSTIAGIGLGTSLIAAMMGSMIARPIRKLTRAAGQLARGDYSARVRVRSRDEFADLGLTFNRMASEIESQKNRIEEKVRENERLLESMLPAPVAARLRSGPSELQSDTHSDVSVVFAAVSGFDAFSESLEPSAGTSESNRRRLRRSGGDAGCGEAQVDRRELSGGLRAERPEIRPFPACCGVRTRHRSNRPEVQRRL